MDAGERPEAALVRELHEELRISVAPTALQPLTFASHAYEAFHLVGGRAALPCAVVPCGCAVAGAVGLLC